MDNLTAVIAALYSTSVVSTHCRPISVGGQSRMISDTYFSKRFRVFEKDRMFSTTVMDTHETTCDLPNCKQLAIITTVSGLCLPRRELWKGAYVYAYVCQESLTSATMIM